VVLIVSTVVPGCDQPAARQRLAGRQHSFERTVQVAAQREASAAERLGRTVETVRRKTEQDAWRFPQDLRMVEVYVRLDVKRWQDRQGLFAEQLVELFAGKPREIPTTLLIFY